MKQEYRLIYSDRAPYEIISNLWIDSAHMVKLKSIEKMLNTYYNRGGFENTLDYMMEAMNAEPFGFFERLADFYFKSGYHHVNRKKEDQYRIMRKFALGKSQDIEPEAIEEALLKDLSEAFNPEEVRRFFEKRMGDIEHGSR